MTYNPAWSSHVQTFTVEDLDHLPETPNSSSNVQKMMGKDPKLLEEFQCLLLLEPTNLLGGLSIF